MCNSFSLKSPAELFAVRNRQQNIPQRSYGQKDFLPDGSNVQDGKLQICSMEQWELLGEERVERLGRLGRGVWRPERDLVELTQPLGKFWQTMGFTMEGKPYLQPEEALYLLECGTIQLFDGDLPLSVQEAYEKLLSESSLTLLHFQVFSHLKRLGYIVRRFNPSSVIMPYEKQLNIDSQAAHSRKRKRSSSHCLEFKPECTINSTEHINLINTYTYCSSKENAPSSIEHAHQISQHSGENTESHQSDTQFLYKAGAKLTRSKWDFSKINFPNCAPDQPCVDLPDPERILLPENILGRPVNILCWIAKLNLHKEKASRRELQHWEWEHKHKISINTDPEVMKCNNWKEYKDLLQARACQKNQQRPPHLWNSDDLPLLMPGTIQSTAFALEKISVISHSYLLDDSKRFQKISNLPQIQYSLYLADGTSTFKKSKPGKPHAHLCVQSFDEHIPSLNVLKTLTYQSGDIPVLFALVDYGEVAFYTLKDFHLPVDVYP